MTGKKTFSKQTFDSTNKHLRLVEVTTIPKYTTCKSMNLVRTNDDAYEMEESDYTRRPGYEGSE